MLATGRLATFTILLVTSGVLAACGGPSATTGGAGGPGGGEAPGAVQGAINLGAVLPLTGSSASIGEDQRRGIELAVEKVNADGGVLGKQLNVVVEDSAGQASAAIDAAKKLTTVDNVTAVLGEYSSGLTVPLGQYLQGAGTIHVNIGSSSPEIAGIGDRSFSVIGLDTIASRFAAEKMRERGYRNVAVLAPNNSYGEGVSRAFAAAFGAVGGSVTGTVLYAEGQTSYRAELDRMAASRPDAYLYTAYGQDSAVINRQAFEAGLQTTPWFGIYLTMCTSDSAPETVDGQIGMDVNYVGPNGAAYRQAYRDKYGEDFASTFNGYAYDGVLMLARAIEQAKSTDAAAVAAALREIGQGYAGVTGDITFDPDNQRTQQPYLVLRYAAGTIHEDA